MSPALTESPTPTSIEWTTAVSSGCTVMSGSTVINFPRAVTTRSTCDRVAQAAAETTSITTR